MVLPRFATLDLVQTAVLESVCGQGEPTSPRGSPTLEMPAFGFTLTNPRARVIENPARRWNMALAVGEFAWHVSGSDDVAALAYYAPIWRTFSEDGAHIRGSCYGKRIFAAAEGEPSQWSRLLRLLRFDPASRRALLSVQQGESEALSLSSLDVPCVTTCQFLLRDGRLDAIVNMRSNDVIWGLPYDVFLFTMLQEMLSLELGVGIGNYHHFAGSMHIYERHLDLARRILLSPTSGGEMPPMTHLDQLNSFIQAERALRVEGTPPTGLPPYWSDLLRPLAILAEERYCAS